MRDNENSYARYLASKKSVDDRSINGFVVERLRAELSKIEGPIQVLDLGGGLGTMAARLIEWNLVRRANWLIVDADPGVVEQSRRWLGAWAQASGFLAEGLGGAVALRGPGLDVKVESLPSDLDSFLSGERRTPPVDLLVANAFLDLIDVPRVLPQLIGLCRPSALLWLTINFDGETTLLPEHPEDQEFLRVYHQSMDERVRFGKPAGDSRTGRHLFAHLTNQNLEILAAGASDWVVHATDGAYPSDEEYFLRCILRTVDRELQGHATIDRADLTRWVERRDAEIDHHELALVVHQLDFLAKKRAAR